MWPYLELSDDPVGLRRLPPLEDDLLLVGAALDGLQRNCAGNCGGNSEKGGRSLSSELRFSSALPPPPTPPPGEGGISDADGAINASGGSAEPRSNILTAVSDIISSHCQTEPLMRVVRQRPGFLMFKDGGKKKKTITANNDETPPPSPLSPKLPGVSLGVLIFPAMFTLADLLPNRSDP